VRAGTLALGANSYEKILDSLHDGLYFVDQDRVITYWNKSAEEISGFTASEVVGKSCADGILTHVDCEGNGLCEGMCPVAATIADGNSRSAEVYMHHKDGHRVPVSVGVSPLTDASGSTVGGIELFTGISDRMGNDLRVRELEKMALLDRLTSLANRTFIERELASRFAERRRLGVSFGVMFLDIDHFKGFNDTYGHDVGDKVLQSIAGTLASSARSFDLFGRWGGDEFIGIIRDVDEHELKIAGDRICGLIGQSYIPHGDATLRVTVSIGGTLVGEDDTMESLLKRVDALLYRGKDAGRNCLTVG
jgi:diguanylate cyclase (GGDEF)-like protein/PAS domain S-box-containing protein